MKNVLFLSALGLGMMVGSAAFAFGGLALLTTGFTLAFIIIGRLTLIVGQTEGLAPSD